MYNFYPQTVDSSLADDIFSWLDHISPTSL